MGEIRAIIGHLDKGAAAAELRRAIVRKTTGVLRLRDGRTIGAIWTVRGEVVHALHVEDGIRLEGAEAFDRLIFLNTGTFYWEEGTLPPMRSIRLPMPEQSWPEFTQSSAANVLAESLEPDLLAGCEADLKSKVPGLSSIQFVALDSTRLRGTPVNLSMTRTDEHLHLSVRIGSHDVHLDATPDTAPEALLWASEVLRRRLATTEWEATLPQLSQIH